MNLRNNSLESLIKSLEELNEAVRKARQIIEGSEQPNSQISGAVGQYQEICAKQLEFAYSASSAIDQNKSEDAIRYINLIENLAELVKADVADYFSETPQLSFTFNQN